MTLELKSIENMQVTFNKEGVTFGESFLSFGDNNYDDFVYTLQKYGLRNLLEYGERFTVTHAPLIQELRKLPLIQQFS
jgi:hypothetical protein